MNTELVTRRLAPLLAAGCLLVGACGTGDLNEPAAAPQANQAPVREVTTTTTDPGVESRQSPPETADHFSKRAAELGCASTDTLKPADEVFADAFSFWGRWQAVGRFELVAVQTATDLKEVSDLLVLGCLTGETAFLQPGSGDDQFRVPDYLVVELQVIEVLSSKLADPPPDVVQLPLSVDGREEANLISQRLHRGVVLLGLFDGQAGLEQLSDNARSVFPDDSFGVIGSQGVWVPTVDGFRSPPRELTTMFGYLEPPACLNELDHNDLYPDSMRDQIAPDDLSERVHEEAHRIDQTAADHTHDGGSDHEHELREDKPVADEFCGKPVDETLDALRAP